jgi:hypothetical protein
VSRRRSWHKGDVQTTRKLPWEPVEEWAVRVGEAPGRNNSRRPLSLNHLAERVGVHHRQVLRWRDQGLNVYAADRVAVAMGLHPLLLWPDFHADLEEEIDA